MNYFLTDCSGNSDSDCSNNFYFYYVNSFNFCCMMSFVIGYWNSVYSLGLFGNWIQEQTLLHWNLILNSYFGYFDYSIGYNYFVKSFVYFFVLVIVLYNLSFMVIDSLCNWCCSEVVFLNCYYYIYFCSVGFDLFSCIGRTIYLGLYAFEVSSDCLVDFVYIRRYCVRIVGNNYTIF